MKFERVANVSQRVFIKKGMASLWLAAASLIGVVIELTAANRIHLPWSIELSVEACAAAAVVLALGPTPRLARARDEWLLARFVTERIRQWQFQLLLDGGLISLAYSDPVRFEQERDHRWSRFALFIGAVQGEADHFVDAEDPSLYHEPRTYSDADAERDARYAYADLRLVKQLTFFELKRKHFAERDDRTETAARTLVFAAVVITAAQLAIALAGVRPPGPTLQIARQWMSGAALLLVVLSTAVRVYRSATALSQQRERYEAKWARLVALRSAFDATAPGTMPLDIVREVERAELDELRDFLRQLRRASFLL